MMERRSFLKLAGAAMLIPVIPDWDFEPVPAELPEPTNGTWVSVDDAVFFSEVITPNGGDITVLQPIIWEDCRDVREWTFTAVTGNPLRARVQGDMMDPFADLKVELVEVD